MYIVGKPLGSTTELMSRDTGLTSTVRSAPKWVEMPDMCMKDWSYEKGWCISAHSL